MEQAYHNGIVVQTSPGTVPRLKRYLDEQEGMPVGDVWTDILPIQANARERTGYPTQKPLALLERIIAASSSPGDVVLDPFCGCGTAVAAAQKLGRRWIGIDITHLSVTIQKVQLENLFGIKPGQDYEVVGEPEDLDGARALFRQDPHQFEWWALSLVGARPSGGDGKVAPGGRAKGKKGGDFGIDGIINFIEKGGRAARAIVSVKGGEHLSPSMVRDLAGTVQRENAALGVLITLSEPSKQMITEAASAGFYHSGVWNTEFPKLQILTIKDLFAGKTVQMPPRQGTFKDAGRIKEDGPDQMPLL